MPLYVFYCGGCDKEFEYLLRAGDHKYIECPECLLDAKKVDCPGGDFRISGIGIADPKSIKT